MGKTKWKGRSSSEQKQTKEQVPQRGFKEAHVLVMVNKGQNKRKRKHILPQNKTKPRKKCSSIVSKMQGGIRFVQWRNRRRRIIWTCFWKSLSRNIAFFCFPLFFLTDCWYIQKWSTSCFVFWELISCDWTTSPCHFRRDFAFYHYEIHRFSPCLVLALFFFLSKDFSPLQSVELVSKVWPQ